MKKTNKNFAECLDAMKRNVYGSVKLELMGRDDVEQHLRLVAEVLDILKDVAPAMDWGENYEWLAGNVALGAEGIYEWYYIDAAAESLVFDLPDGWTREDVEGLWERAIDVVEKRVPPMHKAYTLGNQIVMAAMA